MQKITILSASGREENNTRKVADVYRDLLGPVYSDLQLLSLEHVNVCKKDAVFKEMEETYLIPATHFIIVMPEYNGSYPGILKMLIDQSDVAKCWHHKKVLLTGVATGRAGNLRGMEHLTGCLMHMNMLVHPNRLPISAVNKLLDDAGRLKDENTLKAIRNQLQSFIEF